MKFSHVKTISQYNSLLHNLNPLGLYQIRVFGICILSWMLAGILKTLFDLTLQSFQCKYGLGLFEGLGILVFCAIANYNGRKVGIISAGGVAVVGLLFLLLATRQILPASLGTVSISFIGLSVYAQPCLLLCIVCQLTTQRTIQVVLLISLCAFSLGKIWILPVLTSIQQFPHYPDFYVGVIVLLPICAISLIIGFFVYDSPRYFIENDIPKAQELIEKIAKVNNITHKEFNNFIDQNFIMKRIHLHRYNFLTLTKFNSFGFPQYCLGVVMFLLGMVSRQASFIFSQKTTMVQETVQIVWISGFQIIGILASIFFMKFSKRRVVCLVTSGLISTVSSILYFIYQKQLAYDLVLIGLNAVFSIILYAFLFIIAIEFYPHSIRTLGLGLMLSLYYIGQLAFYIYLLVDPSSKVVLEMIMWASVIMFGHCFGFEETLDRGLAYEIKEIEEEEENQENEE